MGFGEIVTSYSVSMANKRIEGGSNEQKKTRLQPEYFYERVMYRSPLSIYMSRNNDRKKTLAGCGYKSLGNVHP